MVHTRHKVMYIEPFLKGVCNHRRSPALYAHLPRPAVWLACWLMAGRRLLAYSRTEACFGMLVLPCGPCTQQLSVLRIWNSPSCLARPCIGHLKRSWPGRHELKKF